MTVLPGFRLLLSRCAPDKVSTPPNVQPSPYLLRCSAMFLFLLQDLSTLAYRRP